MGAPERGKQRVSAQTGEARTGPVLSGSICADTAPGLEWVTWAQSWGLSKHTSGHRLPALGWQRSCPGPLPHPTGERQGLGRMELGAAWHQVPAPPHKLRERELPRSLSPTGPALRHRGAEDPCPPRGECQQRFTTLGGREECTEALSSQLDQN